MNDNKLFLTENIKLGIILEKGERIIRGSKLYQEWIFKSYLLYYEWANGNIENVITGEFVKEENFLKQDEYVKYYDEKNDIYRNYDSIVIRRNEAIELAKKSGRFFRDLENQKVKSI